MAEEENKKDDGILSTKLGVSKIEAGKPTMAQAIGAGLIYSFLKDKPGSMQGLLDYQDQADEYNKYIEEQEEKKRERLRRMVADRKAKLYALVADYNFGEQMTAAHLADLQAIGNSFGSESVKMFEEAYKVNPTLASSAYKELMSISAKRGFMPKDSEVAMALKFEVIPGRESKFKSKGEIYDFIESASLAKDKDFYRAMSTISTTGATSGGVSYDVSRFGKKPDATDINLQSSVLEKNIKDAATQFISIYKGDATGSPGKVASSKYSSALKDYSGAGKSILYNSPIASHAAKQLAQEKNPIFYNALRFNQDFRDVWSRTGYEAPFSNNYFQKLRDIVTLPPGTRKNEAIRKFNTDYGPNMYSMAREIY